ncbi:DUF6485 family protein [Nitrospirota bacterium]
MDCKVEANLEGCTCTKTSCDRRGKCCLCVKHHRSQGGLPGCFFNAEFERTYDRSVSNFLRMHNK